MVEVGKFADGLKSAGVEFFAGVPDSLLKSFCMCVTDTCVVKKLLHHFYSTNGVPLSLCREECADCDYATAACRDVTIYG